MKKVVIVCRSAPGSKRRLAEEAIRLAAGLAGTGRLQVDLILEEGGLLLLQPEFSGSPQTWDSLASPTSRILVPSNTTLPPGAPRTVQVPHLEKLAQTADFVLRF
ncbi:MAG: hypothetical protein EBZ53_04345 [Verrucomicrobia bacterium]|nr:hypothetical protein [Verrucomicrobiota bacterium]NDD81781.1 hypothetical protein [Verrucomicrobiota bacterium]